MELGDISLLFGARIALLSVTLGTGVVFGQWTTFVVFVRLWGFDPHIDGILIVLM